MTLVGSTLYGTTAESSVATNTYGNVVAIAVPELSTFVLAALGGLLVNGWSVRAQSCLRDRLANRVQQFARAVPVAPAIDVIPINILLLHADHIPNVIGVL